MTKLYAQEKQVFDINKVTVVGSPTITSDGVASGFSSGNYLTISQKLGTNTWKIQCKFKTSDDLTTQQILFNNNGASDGVRIGFVKGKYFAFVVKGINGHIVNYDYPITNLNTQTEYLAEIIFNGTQYICLLNNEVIYSVNSTELVIDNNNWTIGKFATNNLPFLGSIDLTAFKIYVDGELVYSPTKPVYALERRKPKVWNKGQFTIVGNPSISESGVASGFSSANRILITNVPTFDKPFKVKFKIKTGDLTSGQSTFYSNGGTYYNALSVYGGTDKRLLVSLQLSDNSVRALLIKGLNSYSDYIGYFAWSGTEYILHLDGYQDAKYSSTLTMSTSSSTQIKLGCLATNEIPFTGSIDLKQFKIYTDNNLVFDGGAETYVYDASKFTIVGEPTITEYGVASGFSAGNYIGFTNGLNSLTKPFKISCTFKTNFSSTSAPQPLWTIIDTSFTSNSTRLIVSMEKQLVFQIYSGTNHKTPGSSILLDNTWYKAICWQDNDGSMHLKYYPLGHEELVEIKVLDTANLINIQNVTTAVLGRSIHNIDEIYLGQTDLSQFSITVDGKEVFTGAKEKFYAMRGM